MGRQEDIEFLVQENWCWAQSLARSWWIHNEVVEAESAAGEGICLIAAKYVDRGVSVPFRTYAYIRLRSYLIDEWRKRQGRNERIRDRRRSVSMFEKVGGYENIEYVDCVSDDREPEMGFQLEVMEYLDYFPREAQTILVAVAAGWNQNEIADEWGVTESRISQILTRARERFFLRVKEP